VGGTSQAQLYNAFGAYVRSQRKLAQLTLRQAAELASISNPYLSQIEHGLALPSIAVLSALADALSVSAETMLLRAAGLASPNGAGPSSHTEESILQDPRLDSGQKHALLAVLASFVASSAGEVPSSPEQPEAHRDRDMPTHGAVRPAAVGRVSSNGKGE
jgi:transcriptional regulator with XRE-family HTH domain